MRKAEDYAVGHIPGAYNAPGLAKLPITDALPSNLGDCTAKIVAVLPCVVLEPNPNPDPDPNPNPNHNSAAIVHCPVLSAAHAHFCPTRPYNSRTGPVPDWLPGARRRAQPAGPGLRTDLRSR